MGIGWALTPTGLAELEPALLSAAKSLTRQMGGDGA
jgi:hypothetical protein